MKFNFRSFASALIPVAIMGLIGLLFGAQYAVITMQVAFMERTSIAMSVSAVRPLIVSARNAGLFGGLGAGMIGGLWIGNLLGRKNAVKEIAKEIELKKAA